MKKFHTHCQIDDGTFSIDHFNFTIPPQYKAVLKNGGYTGKKMMLGIRAEDLTINQSNDAYSFSSTIEVSELLGAESYLYSSIANQPFIAKVSVDKSIQIGDDVDFTINPKKIHFFDLETEQRIEPQLETINYEVISLLSSRSYSWRL